MSKRKQDTSDLSTVGQRFEWLLQNHLSPDGDEYTYAEILEGLKGHGVEITASSLSKLRNGTIKEPGWYFIDAMAAFFGVPLNFFSLTRKLSEDELRRYRTADALMQEGTDEIAFRAARLGLQ